jgi:esterase/lipase
MKIDYYYKINDNKALLLSHGLFSSKEEERFQKLREVLEKKGISYLFFDYPGHGKSEKRALNAIEFKKTFLNMCKILLKNKVEELTILAESLGCLIALSNYDFIIKNFKKTNFVFIGPLLKPRIPYYLQKEKFMKNILEGKTIEIKQKYIINLDFLKTIYQLTPKYPKEATVFYGLNDYVININEIKKVIKENNLNWEIIYLEGDHILKNNFNPVVNYLVSNLI